MPGQNLVEFERALIAASVANTWTAAVREWDIELKEDPAGTGVRTCGHTQGGRA
ncbi:hypothetical protein ACI2IX_19800 [Leifsonia aquatica]|uniref:hypothetical protein n=1 Tax=Leifsonia aquatica TaxID=144185 RepID=UPI0038504A96